MGTGESFVKWLRPFGCVLFLGMGILITVMLFTVKGTPVEGYTPPQSSEYYSENPDELSEEIRENLLPLIGCDAECGVRDGKVVVTVSEKDIVSVRSGIIYYYDENLFEFNEE